MFTLELLHVHPVRYGTVRCGAVRYVPVYTVQRNSVFRQIKGWNAGENTHTHARTQMNSSASAIMDVQQFSLSLRSLTQRRPFSSGLLERRARRLQRLRQRRAVENRQRRSRSTFLLYTDSADNTTCLLQQCITQLAKKPHPPYILVSY